MALLASVTKGDDINIILQNAILGHISLHTLYSVSITLCTWLIFILAYYALSRDILVSFPRENLGKTQENCQTWRCVRLIIASAFRSKRKIITGDFAIQVQQSVARAKKSRLKRLSNREMKVNGARNAFGAKSRMRKVIAVIE